jgi:hypothetical protein
MLPQRAFMHKTSKATLEVQGTVITVLNHASDEYISLTDIAKHKEPDRSDHIIQNWMRNRNTIEFLGIWERLHNINFKPLEFEGFKNRAGLNSFVLTPRQWIDATNASAYDQTTQGIRGATGGADNTGEGI